ncbi:hypothetical protein [Mucilaginibacter sp.]|uniref:hypothetical protein n=1 Tax=Mucilaginibacter sp. TaxID=1882438 RepID=UPI00262195E2|nr:hypothetical protein [Mucilaginibacter sp.]MDB4924593.1 hypothetical protein [Mucilaginibacter sp.]
MKYAFIIGTSVFIVPNGVISYADAEHSKEIIKIRSIYHNNEPGSALSIDVDIKDVNGNSIIIIDNIVEINSVFTVETQRDYVKVLNPDGLVILNIHQLDDQSAMRLEHYIVAELEVHAPVVVIRISGDFETEGLHITAENEKLFINNNGYATSALAGKDQLLFTEAGVVL